MVKAAAQLGRYVDDRAGACMYVLRLVDLVPSFNFNPTRCIVVAFRWLGFFWIRFGQGQGRSLGLN